DGAGPRLRAGAIAGEWSTRHRPASTCRPLPGPGGDGGAAPAAARRARVAGAAGTRARQPARRAALGRGERGRRARLAPGRGADAVLAVARPPRRGPAVAGRGAGV